MPESFASFRSLVLALAAFVALTACGDSSRLGSATGDVPSIPVTPPSKQAQLLVLSNRADLISGGDALVEVVLPDGADVRTLTVTLDGRDITSTFARRPNNRTMGLVTGLRDGSNQLAARLADGAPHQVTITNHPIGGPVFSGPQIQPWPCLAGALDAQCNRPVTYEFLYKSTNGGGLQTYNPASPPTDVAKTTTDQGKTVPYILRVEKGAQDRSQYQIIVLFDPTKEWQPWAPQEGWNGKIVNFGGSGCGVRHGEDAVTAELRDELALAKGFLTWETALSHNTKNCNLVVQAESLMMAKERIVEAYGPIRYSIGRGGSGGSIKQQQAANAYPGIYDGIMPAASFTDTWSTAAGEVLDCRYLVDYFADPTQWSPGVVWPEPQQAAVMGHPSTSICQTWINGFAFDWALNPRSEAYAADPAHRILNSQACNVTAAEAWDPQTNPGGVRCTLSDYMVNVLGRRPDGVANRPHDNVGVQYGLKTLLAGTITPAQFVDLNKRIGSRDIDYNRVSTRAVADPAAIDIAYRSSLFNQGDQMHLPIIDLRGSDNVEIHHNWHSYEMRARLDYANGHHDNQVIWFNPTVSAELLATPAFNVMDQWLTAIEADTSSTPYGQKVLKHKPTGARDLCTDVSGTELPADACARLNPYYYEPREVAGEPLYSNILKCQLKPLRKADYAPVTFTDAQWTELQTVFADGVCDYSKLDIGRQPTVPWLSYSAGPGGQPLPATASPAGWSAPAFRSR